MLTYQKSQKTVFRYMKSMKTLLAICLTALVFTSCKKEITELPPATQTGANTFGAKVNGALWAPQGFGSLPANDILEARMAGTDLTINARNFSSSPNETEFLLLVKNITGTGTYLLNTDVNHPSGESSYGYYVKRRLTPLNEWITSASYTGSVTITRIDTVARIASGTFQFSALNMYNSPEPITVTEGRFDVTIQ